MDKNRDSAAWGPTLQAVWLAADHRHISLELKADSKQVKTEGGRTWVNLTVAEALHLKGQLQDAFDTVGTLIDYGELPGEKA